MRPSGPVLVNTLSAAWKEFGPVGLTEVQCFRRGIVDVACWRSLRMLCEVAHHRFNELIVRWNRHLYLCGRDRLIFAVTPGLYEYQLILNKIAKYFDDYFHIKDDWGTMLL